MRTEDMKKLILKLFGSREFYGYEVHKVLASDGVEHKISRLYRILNEMLKEGFLESRWEKSQLGPKKRIYTPSKKGREALNEIFLDAIKTVHSFYGRYLLSLVPKINVFEEVYQFLTGEVEGDEIIVFIPLEFTPICEIMIRNLLNKLPRGKVFVVKPYSQEVDLTLDNLLVLDGSQTEIPLKDEYADCILVIDLPKREFLATALKEWHRVLRPEGNLALMTPAILIGKYEDPLTIGDFIEKHEHETIEKGEHIEKEFLEDQLHKYFNNIDEKNLVHMTILRAQSKR